MPDCYAYRPSSWGFAVIGAGALAASASLAWIEQSYYLAASASLASVACFALSGWNAWREPPLLCVDEKENVLELPQSPWRQARARICLADVEDARVVHGGPLAIPVTIHFRANGRPWRIRETWLPNGKSFFQLIRLLTHATESELREFILILSPAELGGLIVRERFPTEWLRW